MKLSVIMVIMMSKECLVCAYFAVTGGILHSATSSDTPSLFLLQSGAPFTYNKRLRGLVYMSWTTSSRQHAANDLQTAIRLVVTSSMWIFPCFFPYFFAFINML